MEEKYLEEEMIELIENARALCGLRDRKPSCYETYLSGVKHGAFKQKWDPRFIEFVKTDLEKKLKEFI